MYWTNWTNWEQPRYRLSFDVISTNHISPALTRMAGECSNQFIIIFIIICSHYCLS